MLQDAKYNNLWVKCQIACVSRYKFLKIVMQDLVDMGVQATVESDDPNYANGITEEGFDIFTDEYMESLQSDSLMLYIQGVIPSEIFNIPECITKIQFNISNTYIKLTGGHGLETCESLFENCKQLESIDLTEFSLGKSVNFSRVFRKCFSLKSIDFGNLDTSKIRSMDEAFTGCSNLLELNINHLSTRSLISLNSAFAYCLELKSLDISNWTCENVTNTEKMFCGCFNIKSINMRSFTGESLYRFGQWFRDCRCLEYLNLESLDISHGHNLVLPDRNMVLYNCFSLMEDNIIIDKDTLECYFRDYDD